MRIEAYNLNLTYKPFLDFVHYAPRFNVHFETSHYILKTAETWDELYSLFSMRYKIFLKDKMPNLSCHMSQLDIDDYDSHADHLLIIDKSKGETCGTYRMIFEDNPWGFYSESEFNLDTFKKSPYQKIEIGRACIEEHHRNGQVLDLLWKGIGQYAKRSQAEVIFGCSSFPIVSDLELNSVMNELIENDNVSTEFMIDPKNANHGRSQFYAIDPQNEHPIQNNKHKNSPIPPLLKSYFHAGSKVCGRPYLDIDFQCFDFFTVLKLSDLSPSFARRYFC